MIWVLLLSYYKGLSEKVPELKKVFSALLSEHAFLFVNKVCNVSFYWILTTTPIPKFSCEWILRFRGHCFKLKRYTPLGKHHNDWVVLGRTHVLYVLDIFLEENKKVNICAFCIWQPFWRAASAFSLSAYQHIRWGTSRLCTIMFEKASFI